MFDKIKKFAEDNWYELLDYIPDNWDRYWDGIPSVTTILSLLKDKWLEYIKRNYPNQLKDACVRWTKIHWDAEDYFNWDSKEIHSQIMKFHILYDVQIINQETKIIKTVDWCTFQWTIDLTCSMNWAIKNIDYKSSKKKSKKYFIQCWWYKILNWYDWWVLYLWEKSFELELVPEWYDEIFLDLLRYFYYLLDNTNDNSNI